MSVYARIVYVSFPWNRVKLIRRKEASSAFSNRRFYERSLSRAVNVEGGNDECEPRCLSNRLPALTSIKQVSRRWKRKRESGATSTEGNVVRWKSGEERKAGGDTSCYWNERLPDIGCLITVVVVNTEHNYRQTKPSPGVH